jgi:hypothetical protein
MNQPGNPRLLRWFRDNRLAASERAFDRGSSTAQRRADAAICAPASTNRCFPYRLNLPEIKLIDIHNPNRLTLKGVLGLVFTPHYG